MHRQGTVRILTASPFLFFSLSLIFLWNNISFSPTLSLPPCYFLLLFLLSFLLLANLPALLTFFTLQFFLLSLQSLFPFLVFPASFLPSTRPPLNCLSLLFHLPAFTLPKNP